MNRKIYYDLQGGEISSDSKLVTEWNRVCRRALPIPVKGDTPFIGWYVEGKNEGFIKSLSPDIVYNGIFIKAIWDDEEKPIEPEVYEIEEEVDEEELEEDEGEIEFL